MIHWVNYNNRTITGHRIISYADLKFRNFTNLFARFIMRRVTQKLQMFKTVKLEWLLFQFRLIPIFLSLIWFATQATLWNYFLYLWSKDKNIFIHLFCSDYSTVKKDVVFTIFWTGPQSWSGFVWAVLHVTCSRLPWIILSPEQFKIIRSETSLNLDR